MSVAKYQNMPADVDRNIHPHSTGAAADLVSAHSAEQPLKLYAGWFCPYVQRAWIVLQERNIPYQYVEINPYHKAPEFLALNPRGLVPTLAVPMDAKGKEQKPLYESTVVCEYLDEAHDGERLLPEDPYERARCRLWIDHISHKVVPGFYRVMQHTEKSDYSIAEARNEFHKHIKTLAREMRDDGSWFLGERFSLVDVMLAPWAIRLWLLDHYKDGGFGVPEIGKGGEDEEAWQRWRVWFDAAKERNSVKETSSDREKYIGVYKRYADNTTNSEVGQATRSGRRLP